MMEGSQLRYREHQKKGRIRPNILTTSQQHRSIAAVQIQALVKRVLRYKLFVSSLYMHGQQQQLARGHATADQTRPDQSEWPQITIMLCSSRLTVGGPSYNGLNATEACFVPVLGYRGSPSGCGRHEMPGVSQVEKETQARRPTTQLSRLLV